MEIPLQEKATVDSMPPYIQTRFIGRVYSIVTLQVLFTAATATCMSQVPIVQRSIIDATPWLYPAACVGSLVSVCAAHAYRTRHPWNIATLGVFTLCESVVVGVVVTSHVTHDGGAAVMLALAFTAIAFGLISTYCLLSKHDFSFLEGGLTVATVALLCASTVFLVLGASHWMQALFAVFGIGTFGAYILFDTWALLNRHSPDEVVPATISLYVDVVGLFVYMLDFLRVIGND